MTKLILEDYRGAIDDFNKTIDINPNYGNAYYYRGLAKIDLNQTNNGCVDLSKAGELGISDAYVSIKKYCR